MQHKIIIKGAREHPSTGSGQKGRDASLKDTVTVRDRDTAEQERVKVSELADILRKNIAGS
jgi:hypothetical protein